MLLKNPPAKVSFSEKFSLFEDQWSPKVVAEMNDYQFKLVRLDGEFVWHQHDETDETFIVLEGKLTIDLDAGPVTLCAGEMLVIPKGLRHRPHATMEAKVLLVEPRGVVNTGDTSSELTAAQDVWV